MTAAGWIDTLMTYICRNFHNRTALVNELSKVIARRLQAALDERGRASISVSGGSTPASLFDALSMLDLPWSRVQVSLVDERWVDEDHADSNAALVKRTLLQNRAANAHFVGMKTTDSDAFAAAASLGQKLHNSILPLDIVLLGMGEDGHTASFFPHARGLEQALDLDSNAVCCPIQVPDMPYTRMTLSLKTILSASCRLLQLHGESKHHTLLQALAQDSIQDMPVRAVLNAELAETEIYYSP